MKVKDLRLAKDTNNMSISIDDLIKYLESAKKKGGTQVFFEPIMEEHYHEGTIISIGRYK